MSLILEKIAGINVPVNVAGFVSQEAEQVGSAVPTAQRWQSPVGREGGDDRVMGVESIVLLPPQMLRDGATNKETIHPILDGVIPALIKRKHSQSILHEILIIQKRGEEVKSPVPSELDIGVVAVIGHVRSHEHMLRQFVVIKILVETIEPLDPAESVVVVRDRVVQDQRVVFPDVVVRAGLRVSLPLETGVGDRFLVLAPCNSFGVEQVGNCRHIGRDLVEVVIVQSECIPAGGGAVVWLRRVRHSPVVGQEEAFLGEFGETGSEGGSVEVLFISMLLRVPSLTGNLPHSPAKCRRSG